MLRNVTALTATLVVLIACAKTENSPPVASTDTDAIKAVNVAWNKAYNAGDGAGVAALYAEDAVLSVPGKPAMRGKAVISEYYVKDASDFASAGATVADEPATDVGQSGDLAWQWGLYRNTNKAGAVVDSGKFLTVFERRGGKWMIVRDMWNSDAVPASAPAASAPSQ
jgi:uncharacterized protein (TIGR02246 family)